jgi:predicted metal-dependent phosphotriesterase family hydrolase
VQLPAHTHDPVYALELSEFLIQEGVDPSRIYLGHVDKELGVVDSTPSRR